MAMIKGGDFAETISSLHSDIESSPRNVLQNTIQLRLALILFLITVARSKITMTDQQVDLFDLLFETALLLKNNVLELGRGLLVNQSSNRGRIYTALWRPDRPVSAFPTLRLAK